MLELKADKFTAVAVCKKAVFRDAFVAERFTALAVYKKAVFNVLKFVTDKFGGIFAVPPNTPFTYKVPKLAFGEYIV
jgi:hypothetical protein